MCFKIEMNAFENQADILFPTFPWITNTDNITSSNDGFLR